MCLAPYSTEQDPCLEQAFVAELDRMHSAGNFDVKRIRYMISQRPDMPKAHEVLGLVLWEEANDEEAKMLEALAELQKAYTLYVDCGINDSGLRILEGDIFEAKGRIAIKQHHEASGVASLQRALRIFSEVNEELERKIPLNDLESLIHQTRQQLD